MVKSSAVSATINRQQCMGTNIDEKVGCIHAGVAAGAELFRAWALSALQIITSLQ